MPARRALGDIAGLAESMRAYNLQQPISVRSAGSRYALTSGLRRVTAARVLGWDTIPAFVRTLSDDEPTWLIWSRICSARTSQPSRRQMRSAS